MSHCITADYGEIAQISRLQGYRPFDWIAAEEKTKSKMRREATICPSDVSPYLTTHSCIDFAEKNLHARCSVEKSAGKIRASSQKPQRDMDWLILLLLIPVVIMPAVLLYGFAGCSFKPGAALPPPTGPTAPISLTATAVPSAQAGSNVTLSWENTDTTAGAGVQIERAVDGGAFTTLIDSSTGTTLIVTGTTFSDTALLGGTTFLYQVRANDAGTTSTDPSNMAAVTTFKTAFIDDGLTADTDQPGVNGFTIVQILNNSLLQAGGALASVTLRGPGAGTLTLDQVFVSNVAAAGDPFDSDVPPVRVTSNLVLNNTTTLIVPANAFVVDQTKPLLLALDVNVTFATMRFGTLPQGGATSYAKHPATPGGSTGEAGVMNRTAPYTMGSVLYLVHKIEVT